MHCVVIFFFFNDTATTEIYTLSLHDALPISNLVASGSAVCWVRTASLVNIAVTPAIPTNRASASARADRKSTRLNSSHANISYAVFCLKKKKKRYIPYLTNPLMWLLQVTH